MSEHLKVTAGMLALVPAGDGENLAADLPDVGAAPLHDMGRGEASEAQKPLYSSNVICARHCLFGQAAASTTAGFGRKFSRSEPAVTSTVEPSRISPSRMRFGERVLQLLLDDALQRPRAIGRIVALGRQPLDRLAVELRA